MNTNRKKILFTFIIIACVFFLSINVSAAEYVAENICGEDSVRKILRLVGYIVMIAKIAVPLIIVVMGSFDLFQAVIGKDDKELGKSFKTLALRLALGVFIFFIPDIVELFFGIYSSTTGETLDTQCITCVLDPNNC